MSKRKEKYKNFFDTAKEAMPVDKFKRAIQRGEQIIAFLRLAEARKKAGLRQSDIDGFTQAEVSKIENRTDIKLSTLIDYMSSLGMGVKIIGIPETKGDEEFEILTTKVD